MIWVFPKPARYIISVGTGIANTSDLGTSQTFPILDPDTDELYVYSPNHSSQNSSVFDAFIGAEWQIYPLWALQLGLDYNQASPFLANGTFSQGVDAYSTDYYTYAYRVSTKS